MEIQVNQRCRSYSQSCTVKHSHTHSLQVLVIAPLQSVRICRVHQRSFQKCVLDKHCLSNGSAHDLPKLCRVNLFLRAKASLPFEITSGILLISSKWFLFSVLLHKIQPHVLKEIELYVLSVFLQRQMMMDRKLHWTSSMRMLKWFYQQIYCRLCMQSNGSFCRNSGK